MKKVFLLILLLPSLLYSQEKEKDIEKEKDKNLNFAFIPIVSYNKSFEFQLGFMASAFFNTDIKDTISPVSSAGIFGSYFTNKTLFAASFSKLYFNENKYRTTFGLGYGDVRFQTFFNIFDFLPEEIPIPPGYDGEFYDYNTKMFFAYGDFLVNLGNNIFLGPRAVYSKVRTEFDSEFIPGEENSLWGVGIGAEFDNRDNIMTPLKGQNAKFNTFSFLTALGSTTQYHKFNLDYNYYFNLGKTSTILARFHSEISAGDVPFSGQSIVGRDDLRGYSQGKYRGNQVYAVQSEYRWTFYKKWGMVAFGGLALATDDWQGTNYSGILPGIGAGVRYKVIPSRDINIGIDVAAGKDDWGLYFRIGEAFGR